MENPEFPIDNSYLHMIKYLLSDVFSVPIQDQSIEELQKKQSLGKMAQQDLENLEYFYNQNLEDLLGGVYDTEKKIRKKWQKEDKVAMGLSLGLVYPVLRKMQKTDKKFNNANLNNLKGEYHLNESFKSEIINLKDRVEEITNNIEKELNKRQNPKKKKVKTSSIIRV